LCLRIVERSPRTGRGIGVVEPVEHEPAINPIDERLLLVEDRLSRQCPIDHRLGHGPSIATTKRCLVHRS
jgi:hypothetical protein